MKRRVEDGHIRDAGEDLFAGDDAAQVRRIVQRCQRGTFGNGLFDWLSDQAGCAEMLAAMYHALANGLHFFQGLQYAFLRVHQDLAGALQRLSMIVRRNGECDFCFAVALIGETGAGLADTFDQPLCQHLLGRDAEQREFE